MPVPHGNAGSAMEVETRIEEEEIVGGTMVPSGKVTSILPEFANNSPLLPRLRIK